MSDDAKAAESAATPASGGGSKIVTILTIVNLVVCLGIGGVLFISHKKQNAQPQIGDIQPSAEGGHGEAKSDEHGGGHGEAKKDEHGGGGGEHGGGHGETKKASNESPTIPLEQFTVNLATPGGTAQKFVRVNIALELATDEVEKEIQAKMPQVRNAIIDLFNSKRPNDLVNAEQREYLKEEIRNALNSFMTNGKVKGVYFTNFAVTG
jgi:flagellar protein FliL